MKITCWLAGVLVALVAGCGSPTEVMVVVKAARSLHVGLGQDIDGLSVFVQPATADPSTFTYSKLIELCAPDEAPSPGCRPQPYADESYEGSLTLPVHLLLRPGTLGTDELVRVFLSAQQTEADNQRTRLRSHFEFKFSAGHRLWLDVPLYAECLDKHLCEDVNQVCKADCPPDPGTGIVPQTCCDTVSLGQGDATGDLGSTVPSDLQVQDLTQLAPPVDLANPPPVCGKLANDSCCMPGMTCQAPLLCDATNHCQPPGKTTGGLGQPCDSGSVCDPDLTCMAGTCVLNCGASDKPCCTTLSNPCDPAMPGLRCFLQNGTEPASPAGAGTGICWFCGVGAGSHCCPRPSAPPTNGSCAAPQAPPLVCNHVIDRTFQCVACGQNNGDPCCDPTQGYLQCSGTNLICNGMNKCQTCGGTGGEMGAGNPCCPGNLCHSASSLTCSSGTCVTCGFGGGPCCAEAPVGSQCTTSYTCSNGSCVHCGGPNEDCCPSGQGCMSGLSCDVNGTCTVPSCGMMDQATCCSAGQLCPGSSFSQPLYCDGAASPKCHNCGLATQACCPIPTSPISTNCTGTLMCNGSVTPCALGSSTTGCSFGGGVDFTPFVLLIPPAGACQ